ncbi:hypothetical protein [Streptomyces sp. NBC_01431]|nr:hypothetical protein [Streptomyces sp. NBC_01431]
MTDTVTESVTVDDQAGPSLDAATVEQKLIASSSRRPGVRVCS